MKSEKILHSLMIAFILLLSPNMVFAQTTQICGGGECAKLYLSDGQILSDMTIDATDFMHGVEMNVPGTAYLINVVVKNAGSSDPRRQFGRGDGRGVVVTGPGARIVVNGGSSNNNSEDGYRASLGGELVITGASANNNVKIGFFAGVDSTMSINDGNASGNQYGVMGKKFTNITIHGGKYQNNTFQGMQLVQGKTFLMDNNAILLDNGGDTAAPDAPWAGIAIFGVKDAMIIGASITRNKGGGILAVSDTKFMDVPTHLRMDSVTISNNAGVAGGGTAIEAQGDTLIEVYNSQLNGKCIETIDVSGGFDVGVIKVEGEEVPGDQDCP